MPPSTITPARPLMAPPLLLALRLAFGLLTLVAIGWQLSIHLSHGYNVLNFFSYFTNLSNVFAAVVLLLGAYHLRAAGTTQNEALRAASVVNMVVVGVVFAVLLRDVDLGSLLPWINFVLHTLMPCVVVADWLLQPPRAKLGARQLLLALIFPALYLVYVLVRGSSIGWYPYPFLNPALVGGYGGVAAYAAGITATFVAVAWLVRVVGNKRAINQQFN
jgi:hypothetical protein